MTTVAGAIADEVCAAAVERWWDESALLLDPDLAVAEYRAALRTRFANPAIRHHLAQIAEDAVHKLRVRVAEPALRLRRRGLPADAAATTIAAWAAQTGRTDARTSVAELSVELGTDPDFVASVHSALKELT